MVGAKFSTVLASGILLLGSSAIAMAQGGPPEDLPTEAVQTLRLENETATNAVENQGENGDLETESHDGERGDATAFSEWVQSLPEDLGCERGLTIAYVARNIGPTEFDGTIDDEAADLEEHLANHPAIVAGCNDETKSGSSEDNRPDDAGAEGRSRAEEARGAAGADVDEEGAGGPHRRGGPPDGVGGGPPSGR